MSCRPTVGSTAAWQVDHTDCDDGNDRINPAADDEICDSHDNNCDALIDDDSAIDAVTWYKDLDGDQFGNTAYTRISCEAVDYYTAWNDLDCDDSNSQINPDIDEDVVGVGDAIDDNCDDELTCYFDGDADGYGTGSLRTTASIHCEFPSQNISAND